MGLAVGVTQLIVGLGDTDGEAGADVGVAGAEVEATSAPTQRANTTRSMDVGCPIPTQANRPTIAVGSGRGAACARDRASLVGDPPGQPPRTSLARVPELTATEAAAGTPFIPGIPERSGLRRPSDRSEDPEGPSVSATVVHPGDRPVDGPRDRQAKGCARRYAAPSRLGGPAKSVQDLDRPAAGVQDACVQGSFRPDPAAVDVASARSGRRRGGAHQDETHGDGCDAHGRTISGPDVGRNRRKEVTVGVAFAVARIDTRRERRDSAVGVEPADRGRVGDQVDRHDPIVRHGERHDGDRVLGIADDRTHAPVHHRRSSERRQRGATG